MDAVKERTADKYQQIEDEVRALAMNLPPSDLGSTRAIQAIAQWAFVKFVAESNPHG